MWYFKIHDPKTKKLIGEGAGIVGYVKLAELINEVMLEHDLSTVTIGDLKAMVDPNETRKLAVSKILQINWNGEVKMGRRRTLA